MRRSFLAAAILAALLLPAVPAPAEDLAAQAAGPGLKPPAHPAEPEAPPAPAHTPSRPDVCAPASPADLKRRVPFTVFAPRTLPAGWVPAVCAYPPGSRRVYGLRIQFRAAWTALPPAGILGDRIAGIAQTKAYLAQLTDKHGEPVRLRGRTARFEPWPPGARDETGRAFHGGVLRWIEQGTLIEIDSRFLTREQMIRLAEELRPLSGTSAGSVRPQLPILPGNSILGMQDRHARA